MKNSSKDSNWIAQILNQSAIYRFYFEIGLRFELWIDRLLSLRISANEKIYFIFTGTKHKATTPDSKPAFPEK